MRAGSPTRRRLVVAGVLAAALTATGAWLLDRDARRGGGTAETARLRLRVPVNPAELDRAGLTRALDLAQRAGASDVSAGAPWWFVTEGRPPDQYDWRPIDRLVEAAAERGMRVHLQLSGTPDAVHPDVVAAVPDPARRIWYPPRTAGQLEQWGRFVHATVAHFKGRVHSFEIWNEPNIEEFWAPAPAPAEYARLLAAAYHSAKRAWAEAEVVFGGLSHNDLGYLQRYYTEARRLFPDAAAHRFFFDVLDVHPYTDGRSPDETSPGAVIDLASGVVDKNFSGLRRMKTAMDQNEGVRGSGGKTIVVGEYGFTTTGTDMVPAVPDRRRAYFLKRAVAVADGMPFVSALSWYGLLPDSATAPGWAIITAAGETGWTYQALADLAAGGGPEVRLPELPAPGPGPAPIRPVLDGLDARDVVHTELYVNGVLQAEAAGPAVQWSHGGGAAASRVQLVVYTRDRHAWPSEVTTVQAAADRSE